MNSRADLVRMSLGEVVDGYAELAEIGASTLTFFNEMAGMF
jgi:hypothetical protein